MSLENHIKNITGALSLRKKEKAIEENAGKPFYTYTGPVDTREADNWEDKQAYKFHKQDTPTGSIHITHPDIEMLCRVTDSSSLPGFLITCKDNEGRERELHVFFNNYSNQLVVCTSNKTDVSLAKEMRIRKSYAVPFKDNNIGKGDENGF